MKRRGTFVLITISIILILFGGCSGKKEPEEKRYAKLLPYEKDVKTEESYDWTMPQEDRTLRIGVEGPFDVGMNPFMKLSPSSREVMSMIYTCPLHMDGTPWAGNIETVVNEDGTLTATVTIRKGMVFSDGVPIMIDDWIYGFYVASDPSMTDPLLPEMTGIEGMNEYRYDEPDWQNMLEEAALKAELFCSPDVITQEDFEYYMIKSELEGRYTDTEPGDWKDYIEEQGFGNEWNRMDNTDRDEVLALLATVEAANHLDDWDPVKWWTGEFLMEEMLKETEESKVAAISGIRKIDDWTCTVTFIDEEHWSLETINKPLVPVHEYGIIRKGNLSEILSVDIPLGSGPYKIASLTPERVRLTANNLYFEGTPMIGNLEFLHVNDIDDALSKGIIDIVPSPVSQDMLEKVFTKTSLNANLREGEMYERELWKLLLK